MVIKCTIISQLSAWILRDKQKDKLVDEKQNYPLFKLGLMVESFDTDSPNQPTKIW